MRIAIDLQGAQASSRHRGIGRYSMQLAQSLARIRGDHEVFVVLNGAFPDSIAPIRDSLEGLLPKSHIMVWQALTDVAGHDAVNNRRRIASEKVREAFLASLEPDWVLVASLLEGYSDDVLTSIGRHTKLTTAVVLYDLIPLIHKDIYLQDAMLEKWYFEKLEHLKRADLLLSISKSSGEEAVEHLGLDPANLTAVGTDCDARFQPEALTPEQWEYLRQAFGLKRPFVMYTGGIDHRKNIEGLIRAYAGLPEPLRSAHQLAVVCDVPAPDRERLTLLSRSAGLASDEFVLTGFVSDEDLNVLYNACKLFVFPSWHEGFGLPVLEAMRCGKAVIAANTSSLPEVVGREDALFAPRQDRAMTSLMQRTLEDDVFRRDLERHAATQCNRFSWEATAKQALKAMEMRQVAIPLRKSSNPAGSRPRLAYVSPLPPERSGIADYSSELLPVLNQWYDIEVIVAQTEVSNSFVKTNCQTRTVAEFRSDPKRYERVVYHFGNSHFHEHMFALLEEFPGVVVLHDFFLSGIQMWRDVHGAETHAWSRSLQISHGYNAVRERSIHDDLAETVMEYPANLPVLQGAIAVVVHSEHSRELARHWYGREAANDWKVIPLLRTPPRACARDSVRTSLGIANGDLLVCSFGLLAPTKLNHRLLQAWLASPMATDPKAHLVFVGENHSGEYGEKLERIIKESPAAKRIRITGWTDTELFQQYLAAADIGVQLRTFSRGETSATALDCMNHGLATIVNAHGSMADLDANSVWLLPDEFSDEELTEALTKLAINSAARIALGEQARAVLQTKHEPERCASLYFDAIEHAYRRAHHGVVGLLDVLSSNPLPDKEQLALASSLAVNFPPVPRRQQVLIHIPEGITPRELNTHRFTIATLLREWLEDPSLEVQVEPIQFSDDSLGFVYARKWTCSFLRIPADWVDESPVDVWAGDIFIEMNDLLSSELPNAVILSAWRDRGVTIWWFTPDQMPNWEASVLLQKQRDSAQPDHTTLANVDGVVVMDRNGEQKSSAKVNSHVSELPRTLHVEMIPQRHPSDAEDRTIARSLLHNILTRSNEQRSWVN
jgi:glycosyltransferase involved in cell wall biosynthesis